MTKFKIFIWGFKRGVFRGTATCGMCGKKFPYISPGANTEISSHATADC